MSDITGTVIKLKDFLFNIATEIKIKYNGDNYPVLYFKEGRKLSVPDYQREIRWKKEILFSLMNDISHGSKFLGNIILSASNEKDFQIIDGQQRIVSLNMLINYISDKYGTEISDIGELVDIHLNCFEKFCEFQKNNYCLDNIDPIQKKQIIESDRLKQTKLLSELYEFIGESKIINTVDKARNFLDNLRKCQVNIIVANEEDIQTSTEYYIDVNLKGIKLDIEDIFKGYLFSLDASDNIRDAWVELKETWIKFDENLTNLKLSNAYPLTKILEHYLYCYIMSKPEYTSIRMDEEFLLTEPCDVKGTHYYTGDHIIKAINNNTYMSEVVKGATNYINCLNEIVETDGGVPAIMKSYLSSLDSQERRIVCNIIKKSVIDKVLIVPKMLVLKYYLQISQKKVKTLECKRIYAVYFYTVLFMLFGDKKSDAEIIKRVSRSNDYYNDLIREIKIFVSDKKLAATRFVAIARWNSNYDNEELKYKCKSLATIYNFFKLHDNYVSITSASQVNAFLDNEDEYSVEHFIVNQSGTVKYLDDVEEYPLPDNTRQYNSYIFNFIFVSQTINGDILKNYSLQKKISLLQKGDYIKNIKCEYSKMIISVLTEMFKIDIDIKTLDSNERDELDKYWLVTFKREYARYAATVVDNIIDRFKRTIDK